MTTSPVRTYRGEASEERRSRRRAQLLEAGLQLLGTEGWLATTVTAICERARLTPRYFYESFADRDELLVAIFDGVIAEVTREVMATNPAGAEETLRATMRAFAEVVTDDPRKGRALFLEALGSEALWRRRIEGMHWFAERLADQVRAGRRLRKDEARRLMTASLIAAGGLIETMIAWLDRGLNSTADELIEDYTRSCAAGLNAALGDSRRSHSVG
jgi:AcrR family transcriptional regulator